MPDLTTAALAVLGNLRQVTTVPNWALTRTVGPQSVVLASSSTPALRGHRVLDRRRHHEVVSASIVESDGREFGRLVGYVTDRELVEVGDVVHAVAERAAQHHTTVDVFASLLGGALERDRLRADHQREAERCDLAPLDSVTGLIERVDWDRLLTTEGERCSVLEDPASMARVEPVELGSWNLLRGREYGDEMLREIAFALRTSGRRHDARSRLLGRVGDEFRVVLLGEPELEQRAIEESLRALPFEVTMKVSRRRIGERSLAPAWERLRATSETMTLGQRVADPSRN